MAEDKAKLDTSRPYASISSITPQKAVYEQDGTLFGQDLAEVGKVPGFVERKKEAEKKVAKKAAGKQKVARAKKASAILGDLGDPVADARKENAAAKRAEKLAD